MNETPETVREWAEETFGPASIETQVNRATTEFNELLDTMYRRESPEKIALEAADVCICLYRLIGQLNPEAINQKMVINRARKWNVVDGVGQHVKDAESV